MKKYLLVIITLFYSLNAFAQLPSWLPANGLVAWYPFNGNANDESGNAHNGTVNTAILTTDRFGNSNSAYSFNGVTGYISVPDNPALRLNNTNFTISSWVNETNFAVGNLNAIISKRIAATSQAGYIVGIEGLTLTDPGTVLYQVSGGVDPKAISTDSLSLNVWHHIVIQYSLNTQTLSIYIDGLLNSSTPNIPSPYAVTSAAMWIGNDVSGSAYCFNGKIDDIAIYNRLLLSCEINQLHSNASVSITTQPVSQSFANGTSALFTVASADTCLNYQWQVSFGSSFANLLNAGIYSGVNNDSLVINPISSAMNGWLFRCLVSSCVSCSDTSTTAVLNISTGVNEFENEPAISIFPNPTSNNFMVEFPATTKTIEIYNSTGQLLQTKNVNGLTNLNFELNEGGIYFISIATDSHVYRRKISVCR